MKVHSQVDLITNSSSEIFVFSSHRDEEEVKKQLNEILGKYGLAIGQNYTFGIILTKETFGHWKSQKYPEYYADKLGNDWKGWLTYYKNEPGDYEFTLGYPWDFNLSPEEEEQLINEITNTFNAKNYQEG